MKNNEKYIRLASLVSECNSIESELYNKRRLSEELRSELSKAGGKFGLEFTGHSFKQIAERLEELAKSNTIIYKDVYKGGSREESLLYPSNLKSFILTLLADANQKGNVREEKSKNTNEGIEHRYTVDIKKWSGDKPLKFVAIVEDTYIKTGYFNWS